MMKPQAGSIQCRLSRAEIAKYRDEYILNRPAAMDPVPEYSLNRWARHALLCATDFVSRNFFKRTLEACILDMRNNVEVIMNSMLRQLSADGHLLEDFKCVTAGKGKETRILLLGGDGRPIFCHAEKGPDPDEVTYQQRLFPPISRGKTSPPLLN